MSSTEEQTFKDTCSTGKMLEADLRSRARRRRGVVGRGAGHHQGHS